MTAPTTPIPATNFGTGSRTLAEMVGAMAARPGVALRISRNGWLTETTYSALGVVAREIASGLIGVGIEPGDRVALLSETRPEWTLADFGVTCAGAALVPIYHTNASEECHYVLEHSEARVVICENAGQLAKIEQVRSQLPALEHIVAIEDSSEHSMSMGELRQLGASRDPDELAAVVRGVEPDDLATIIYTSGTTGPPKGCMVTHGNWTSTIRMYEERLELRTGDPIVIFLFLPLAHALARITQFVSLDVGGTLAYWSGSTASLLEDIAATRPTHVPAVPRVFEKIHTKAAGEVEENGSPLTREIFHRAVATGHRARELEREGQSGGPLFRLQRVLADRLVLSKVRALFGPDLQLALTGAAPIAPEIIRFFDDCGVLVVEGYGMTESCAAATLNTPNEFEIGSVGRPLPEMEVRIASDGEILMRGPNVFAGYFKNEEATHETLVDGWLHTGDLGAIDADGYLHVTGRKKELIITSSGKNISPANIETLLRETRWISHAAVYGDNRSYLVALVTLDPDEIEALAEKCGVTADPATMASDERVRAEMQIEVDAVNERLARIEQIKRFDILEHDMTQENGELTPTMKLKRAVVYERYAERFSALYDRAST
jgi:long-chain acyl-CoA synthetase